MLLLAVFCRDAPCPASRVDSGSVHLWHRVRGGHAAVPGADRLCCQWEQHNCGAAGRGESGRPRQRDGFSAGKKRRCSKKAYWKFRTHIGGFWTNIWTVYNLLCFLFISFQKLKTDNMRKKTLLISIIQSTLLSLCHPARGSWHRGLWSHQCCCLPAFHWI